MEGSGGIREAEKHDHWFEEATIRLECGFPLVTVAHSNIIVPPPDIQLRKERRPAAVHSRESIHEFPDEREWGGIANGEGVQSAVVLNQSEIAVFLFNKEERERISVTTVRPGLLFFFSIPSPPPSPYYRHPPCLADCAPSLLSITCLTLAFTVPPTRASVPADVHPLCTFHTHISSPLPYVSLHLCAHSPTP